MALTSAQIVNVRRFAGYSVSGDAESAPFGELVYTDTAPYGALSLDYRLQHLTDDEEAVVTSTYLANLTRREQEIQDAACGLDTDKAAVWTRNKDEISDRRELFNQLRRDLCTFLGIPAGPGLMSGNRLVRA